MTRRAPPAPGRRGAPCRARRGARAAPARGSFLPSGRHLAAPACGSRPRVPPPPPSPRYRGQRLPAGAGGGAGGCGKGTAVTGWARRLCPRSESVPGPVAGRGCPAAAEDASGRVARGGCRAPCARSPHLCSHTRLLLALLLFPQMKETIMNQEKLAKLQAQVRIGGKVGAASRRCYRDCVSLPSLSGLETGVGAALSALSLARLFSGEAVLLQGPLE